MLSTKMAIFGCVVMAICSFFMDNLPALFASLVALCGWMIVYNLEDQRMRNNSITKQRETLASSLPGGKLTGNWIEWEDIPVYFSKGKGSVVIVVPNQKIQERYFRDLIREPLGDADIHFVHCHIRSRISKAEIRFVSLGSNLHEKMAGVKFNKYYWVI